MERIIVAGLNLTCHFKEPQLISIRATVATRSGARYEAQAILNEAMECWENKFLAQIAVSR